MPNRYAGTVRAPEFPPDSEWIGPRLTLAGLRGKLVLLDFWTYCCINCMHIVPNLRELERRHPDDLVVIGVHSAKFPAEQQTENIAAAVARLGIHHPVVNDADHTIWDAFAVNAWPTLMVIDPMGRVIGKHSGEFELETLDAFLSEAIAEFETEGAIDRRPLDLTVPDLPDTSPLRFPGKVLADEENERLFIADTGHHRIVIADFDGAVRRIIGSGEAGLLAGSAESARFNHPQGMSLSPDGSMLAVAETGNHAIRLIHLATGESSTIAGTGRQGWGREGGPALETDLASPWDLLWQNDGIWIAMAGWHQIWRLDPDAGTIEPAAGTGAESIHDGPLMEATFAQPSGITAVNGVFYIADSETSAVRSIDPAADRVQRLVGRGLFLFGDIDARGDSVRLQHPLGVTAGRDGDRVIYLADSYNNKIKELHPVNRSVITIFGTGDAGSEDGDADEASFWEPGGLSLAGGKLYVADTNNHAIRVCDLDTRMVRTMPLAMPEELTPDDAG